MVGANKYISKNSKGCFSYNSFPIILYAMNIPPIKGVPFASSGMLSRE
jgi:hypothetical protein